MDFFGPFPWENKQKKKKSTDNPPKSPRFSRQLFDQNPLREISALTDGLFLETAGSPDGQQFDYPLFFVTLRKKFEHSYVTVL